MKYIIPIALLLLTITSCTKKSTVIPSTSSELKYGGSYIGLYSEHDYTAQDGHITHYDTSYAYTVGIVQTTANVISLQGFTGADNLTVDDEGSFEFDYFHHHFNCHFFADSLHISSIENSGTDSTYYSRTTIKFSGKKQ